MQAGKLRDAWKFPGILTFCVSMLDAIEPSILQELELHVRYSQALHVPSVRSIMLSSPAPIEENGYDEEFDTSLYTLSREDTPIVSNSYETLVTVLPETPVSPLTPKSEEDEGVFAMDEDQQKSKKKVSSKSLPADSKQQQQTSASSSTGSTTGNPTWHGWAPTPAMSVGSFEYVLNYQQTTIPSYSFFITGQRYP